MVAVLLGIGALAVAVIAFSRAGETVAVEGGLIGPEQIEDGAIVTPKLADRSVTGKKLADGAVVAAKIADAAVSGDKVEADSLTGAQIAESTLRKVPAAKNADRAGSADAAKEAERAKDADTLDGLDSTAFLGGVQLVEAASDSSATDIKTVTAECPAGTVAVGGGASIESEATAPIAITRSSADSSTSWVAEARAYGPLDTGWTLSAVVLCATTGG